MNPELAAARPRSLPPALTLGFAATLALACTWFVTHLPWLGVQNQVAVPIILTAWFMTITAGVARLPRARAIPVGLLAGLVSGLAGIVFFGTTLARPPTDSGVSPGVVPSAPLLVAGFLGLALAIGLVAGLVGRLIARPDAPDHPAPHALARFALLTALAVVPLITIGGLVTSTQSGMAVPDWPSTYGANMFLYPLGAHSQPGVYLEHAHRLFGAFVGVTAIVLLIFTLSVERRRWVRTLAAIVFGLVVVQGVLGGLRVWLQTRFFDGDPDGARRLGSTLAAVHGVLAQLTFGTVCALATVLSDHFRALMPGRPLADAAVARRAKFLCTGATHALILQLVMGAWFRHFRLNHPLWTHMGLSLVVFVLVLLAGFTLMSPALRASPVGRRTAPLGAGMVACVFVQFLLGWATYIWGSPAQLTPATVGEALLRTAHQANGALLLGLTASAFVWGKRLGRGLPARAATPAQTA
jgi:cytochrome c oxidase assembly protein subunit 15